MIEKRGKKIFIRESTKETKLLAMLQKAMDLRNENSSRKSVAAKDLETKYYQYGDLTHDDRQAILETIVQVIYDDIKWKEND